MVSAVVQDGNLTITGNAAPNEIAIYAGDNPGEILIAGATTTGDASGNTVVNGSHAPVLLTGVTGNIAVNLAGGDDRVVVTNVNLAGNLDVNLGTGDDELVIRGDTPTQADIDLNGTRVLTYDAVNIQGALRVTGAAGDDAFTLANAAVKGNLLLSAGNGDDRLVVQGQLANNQIGGSVFANMGYGDDVINAQNLNIAGKLTIQDTHAVTRAVVKLNGVQVGSDTKIDLSDLNDVVVITGAGTPETRFETRNLILTTHGGNDFIGIAGATTASAFINAGVGNDVVQSLGNRFSGSLVVNAQAGSDAVTLRNTTATNLQVQAPLGSNRLDLKLHDVNATNATIQSGNGNDRVEVTDSVFAKLALNLAGGDDSLFLCGITASELFNVDAGDGLDQIAQLGVNQLSNKNILNFDEEL
jgi:hypothetical protein